jgi:hypothetical protein
MVVCGRGEMKKYGKKWKASKLINPNCKGAVISMA